MLGRLLIGLSFYVAAGLGEGAGSVDASTREAREARLITVVRRLQEHPTPTVAELREELERGLRDTDLRLLAGLLVDRRVPGIREDEEEQVLNEFQEALILDLVSLEPRIGIGLADALVSETLGEEARALPREMRCAALLLTGACGGASELERAFELARDPGAGTAASQGRTDPALRKALTASLERMLRRDSACARRLEATWWSLDDVAVESLLFACGSLGDPRFLELIAPIVTWREQLMPLAAAQIAQIGPSASLERNADLARTLSEYLDPADPNRCRSAARAIAALGDFAYADRIVALLEAPHAGLRADALAALQQLTGRALLPRPELWREWLSAEQRWSRGTAPSLLAALKFPDAGVAARAVGEIAQRRYDRHYLARELAAALVHPDPEVRGLAAAALGTLGSPHGIPALVDAFQDPEYAVAEAALSSLQRITGGQADMSDSHWTDLAGVWR